jgi:hypothetical protein
MYYMFLQFVEYHTHTRSIVWEHFFLKLRGTNPCHALRLVFLGGIIWCSMDFLV